MELVRRESPRDLQNFGVGDATICNRFTGYEYRGSIKERE